MHAKIVVLFTIFILLHGCVESAIYPSEKETILRERCIDRDEDGRLDQCVCVFAPKTLKNVSVQRQIVVERTFAAVQLFITNNATGIVTIKIDEAVPPQLTTRLEKVTFDVTPTSAGGIPIVASWSFTFSEPVEKSIGYTVSTFQDITCRFVEAYYLSPHIKFERYDVMAIPFFATTYNTLLSLYNELVARTGFYPGIAMFTALLVVVAFAVWELALWLAAYVVSLSTRRKYSIELLKIVGRGRREWAPLALVAILMLVVATSIFLTVGEAAGSATLPPLERLGRNPPHLLGVFVFLLGTASVCTIAIDALRGAFLGRAYFMSPLDAARGELARLNVALDRLESKIEELAAQKISIDKELIVLDVERGRAKRIEAELSEESAELYIPVIRKAVLDVDTSLALLEDKRIAALEWPRWSDAIAALLRTTDSVSPEQLTMIPARWRRWAMMRYISEHLGEALGIEGGALVRIKVPKLAKVELERAAGAFVRQFDALGFALARKDGLLIIAELPKDIDRNVISAIAARFIATASICGAELGRGRITAAILRTDVTELAVLHGRTLIALAILPPGATTAFVLSEMRKIVEKFEKAA